MIQVVSIGSEPDYTTIGALKAMRGAERLVLRTSRHGVVKMLLEENIKFESLDFLYENAGDFDELNAAAAEWLINEWKNKKKNIVYAVPDACGDRTVTQLRELCGTDIELKIAAGTLGVVMEGSHSTVYASDIYDFNPDTRMPLYILELDSRILAGEWKIKLLDHYPAEHIVYMTETPGKPEIKVELSVLDRLSAYDHKTAVFVPKCPREELKRFDFRHLTEIMSMLRAPGGCPWDREQTHESLGQYLVEEAYEVLDAIENEPERLYDELGDVLLQVVFHSQIADEHCAFDISDVTTAICSKMISRHEHIFGDKNLATSEQVLNNWEKVKMKEKGLSTALDALLEVPTSFPALMRAIKVQKKAARAGFDYVNDNEIFKKTDNLASDTETDITKAEQNLGDLLFACSNIARKLDISPEIALSKATERFIARFGRMESAVLNNGKQLFEIPSEEIRALWKDSIS